MSKIAEYLQEHLHGEVTGSDSVTSHFSTDGSILVIKPQLVAYPRNELDIRKITRFAWQLAEKGKVLPLTPRGLGSNTTGSAIGSGVIVTFPAHMNNILSLDTKTSEVVVQPGLSVGRLRQVINTHFLDIPVLPHSMDYSTIGAVVAENSTGPRSVKYGSISSFVKSLKVVLSNGELIITGPKSKKEVAKLSGETTLEAEIYRGVVAILEDSNASINNSRLNTVFNNSGYDLASMLDDKKNIDLTKLFVGSQGTLGIISEITLNLSPINNESTKMYCYFDSNEKLKEALEGILRLKPSMCEYFDGSVFQAAVSHNSNALKDVANLPHPAAALVVEFDNTRSRERKKLSAKALAILTDLGYKADIATTEQQLINIERLVDSTASINWQSSQTNSIPCIEDSVVPIEKFMDLIDQLQLLATKFEIPVVAYGSPLSGQVSARAFLDLKQLGDRQRVFKLMNAYYEAVIQLGGSTSGSSNDGRMRAPYVRATFGDDMYNVFIKTKSLFDPYMILNPGVKIGTKQAELMPLMRTDYSIGYLHNYAPKI
jgi:FAD/FMN-containing dehydrogenase